MSVMPTEELIKKWCVKHGGQFHGPNVEHLSMPESALLALFAEAAKWAANNQRSIDIKKCNDQRLSFVGDGVPGKAGFNVAIDFCIEAIDAAEEA